MYSKVILTTRYYGIYLFNKYSLNSCYIQNSMLSIQERKRKERWVRHGSHFQETKLLWGKLKAIKVECNIIYKWCSKKVIKDHRGGEDSGSFIRNLLFVWNFENGKRKCTQKVSILGSNGTQNRLGCLDVGPVQGRKGGEMERLMKAGPWKP